MQKEALVYSTTDTLKNSRLRERTEPGLVALYDIWPGLGAGLFLHGVILLLGDRKGIQFEK